MHRFVLEVLLGGNWDQVGVVLLAAFLDQEGRRARKQGQKKVKYTFSF